MGDTAAWEFLHSLWSESDSKALVCCQCGNGIHLDDGLARTFTLESRRTSDQRQPTLTILLPADHDAMLVYDRHLQCLLDATLYITISHVWNPKVADLQRKSTQTTSLAAEVAHIVRDTPALIARSLMTSAKIPGPFEIWHDYISVPQWSRQQKNRIIRSIPDIFGRALTTVAYLADVYGASVDTMRTGTSFDERCRAMTSLCTSAWFGRVWTAMEMSQSRKVQIMFGDFNLFQEDALHGWFLTEINQRWQEEMRKHGNFLVEKLGGRGDKILPWQLGSFTACRDLAMRGNRISFGTAHELLSRRGLTYPRDFFHALLGILRLELTEAQLSDDTEEAMLQVARSCLTAGDFSLFFMIPASAQITPSPEYIRASGYLDLLTFAIGEETDWPEPLAAVNLHATHVDIRIECLGTVECSRRAGPRSLETLLRLALEFTGRDVDEFVTTLVVRLYGQEHHRIFHRLAQRGRMQVLCEQLSALRDTWPAEAADITERIAETLGLKHRDALGGGFHGSTLSPMEFLATHGGSMHLADAGGVVGVACPHCHKTFLIRVALLKPPSELLGVKAYRIPGLRYRFSHLGGCGFLLKDRRIVGRFIWGSPTCECQKLEWVEIVPEAPPVPQPNEHRYGLNDQAEWSGLRLDHIVRWTAKR